MPEEFVVSGGDSKRKQSENVPAGGVVNGQNTVASAGTAEVLASDTTVRSVTIRAHTGNTGEIFVGDLNVSSATGYILSQGEQISLDIDNLIKVYIDAATTADGVSFIGVV